MFDALSAHTSLFYVLTMFFAILSIWLNEFKSLKVISV